VGNSASDDAPTIPKRMYYLFVGNIVSTLILAITAIFVGRLLGPGRYGLYTLALVMPGYVSSIALLGLPFAATRFPAKYSAEGDREHAVSFIQSLTIAGGVVGIVGSVALIPFSGYLAVRLLDRPVLAFLMPIALMSVFGQLLYQIATSGFQGLNRMERSAQMQVFQAVVKLLVSLFLIIAGFGVAGAVVGYTTAFLASGLVSAAYVFYLNRRMILRSNFSSDMKEAVRYSTPVFLSNLLAGVVPAYLVTLLAKFSTNAQIGGYGASQNLVALISLFIYPISTVLFPHFSGLSADGEGLRNAYQTSVKYSTIFIVPVAVVMMSLSTIIASAIYGRAYSFAGDFLLILMIPYLFAGIGSLAQVSFLNGIGETRKTLAVGALGSGITFFLGALLAPVLSVYGVLAASVAGNVASYLLAARMVARIIGSTKLPARSLLVYPASAIAAAFAYTVRYIPTHPIIQLLIGASVFFALLMPILALFGAVNDAEIQDVRGFFKEMGFVSRLLEAVLFYYILFKRSNSESKNSSFKYT